MLLHQLALVSEESSISATDLAAVGAALQKQVTRDFAPLWRVNATVDTFASLDDVPLGYWPLIVMDDIGDPNAAGYHQDDHGQNHREHKRDDARCLQSHVVNSLLASQSNAHVRPLLLRGSLIANLYSRRRGGLR